MDESLIPFLKPRGIAVIGVSTSPEKLGYGIARNLVHSGFPGGIYFVSQKAGDLFGRTILTHLDQAPDPLDLAVIVVPASAVPQALRECAARGVHAATVISAGFRETGADGARLEQECLEIARTSGIRLLGPNCIGTIDTHVPLDTSFLQPPMPPKGGIAFVSHSGAFGAAVVDWSRQQGFGFSQIVSLGNQADVNETDILPLVAQDENTRAIALYLEGVSDGGRFVRVAGELTRRRPIVALKVGRFEAGQRAVASHTGALAASDVAFDAAFVKAGIFRADSTERLFDWARALEVSPLPSGDRIAVLTNAGGPGVIAADALEMAGLRTAALSDSTRAILTARLPASASVANPVDMLASASPADYAACLLALLDDPNVDAIMVILPPPPMFTAEAVAAAVIPIIAASAKPVVVALLGSQLTAAAFDLFSQSNIPTYPFPERAASALDILWRRSRDLAHADEPVGARPFPIQAVAGASARELTEAYGIPGLPVRLARSPAEAARIVSELGPPVALKVSSPTIVHKSDVGGVLLNVRSADEASRGYAQVMRAVESLVPGAAIDGVDVQRQVDAQQEVIVGAVRDPNFGPLLMFGSGGVEAEALKDVAFALAPLNTREADELMNRTWAGRRLDGYRNIKPADRQAVRDAVIRLSWLAHEHPEIAEIEINPLAVLERGVFAVDVRSKT